MKSGLFIRNLLIVIAILLALNIILPLLSNPATSYAAKNIEYKVIRIHDIPYDPQIGYLAEPTEKLFNEYGKEGWELIPMISASNLVIFKR
jgi:hypothetical protein